MRFRTLILIAVLASLFAVLPGSSYSQSQPAAVAQAPAVMSAPPPPASQTQVSPIANAKPAKVWTNDEIDTLQGNHGVSVVGKSPAQKVSATSKAYPQEKDAAWYRNQLAPLRAEIDKLDPQIAKFKAFLSGENISDPPTMHRQMVPSPQDQLKQMEAKREADAAKMEDLLDRARHSGIEPGALR
jgi:hypothetical protein